MYTLVVSNNGPDAAQNVVVTDTLRENAAFVSAVGADCVADGQYLSCRVAILPVGQDCLIEIKTLTVQGPGAPTPTPGSTIQNTASVKSDTPDPDTSNNTSNIVNTVIIPMMSSIAAGAIGLAGAGVGILYLLRRRRRTAATI